MTSLRNILPLARRALVTAACLGLCACAGGLGETHYLSTVDRKTGEVVNVFRLTVKGGAGVSNMRYVSGYYDERAVDLFFNEIKAGPLKDSAGQAADARLLFPTRCDDLADAAACRARVERDLAVVPVGGEPKDHGAFVLLLSSDPSAVVDAIGSFVDTRNDMEAAVFLATRGSRAEAERATTRKRALDRNRTAALDELDTLVEAVNDSAVAADAAAQTDLYLAMLRTIAASLEPGSPPRFATLQEARAWFAAQPRGAK